MKRKAIIRDIKTNRLYYSGWLLLEGDTLLELCNRLYFIVENLPACKIHCGWIRDDDDTKTLEKTTPEFEYDTVHLLLTNEEQYLNDVRRISNRKQHQNL